MVRGTACVPLSEGQSSNCRVLLMHNIYIRIILSVNNKINHCWNKRHAVCDDSFGPDLRKTAPYEFLLNCLNKMFTGPDQMYSC